MRNKQNGNSRWCRVHAQRYAHDPAIAYACGHGVRFFQPGWSPTIRFIAKFGCVLRHLVPLDAVRTREFAVAAIGPVHPADLPTDALVAIFFAHGIKWPAAVGYYSDVLSQRARPWTASDFEDALRKCILLSDGEARPTVFRGMNSTPRMHATTGLAVNGVA